MTADLAAKYDLRVPRYTSYPTAPHFSEAVDDETYEKWLAEMNPATELSLYFHIPFCDEMCWFCGCYTKIVKKYEPVTDYLTALLAEIDVIADRLPARMKAKHLHWGGGSPTMLKGEDWRRIIEKIRARFDVAEDAEIAVELDPRTASEDYIRELAEAGVNRTSIGVQDYDEKVQKAINRIQPYEMTAAVIGWLRQHGIENINMDLMYGLPHQTVAGVIAMARRTAELKPRRIALFGYAHVPWMKSHMKMINEDDLPGIEDRWAQFDAASKTLVDAGYVAVGLDHFALPGDSLIAALEERRLHRNFQGYTSDPATVLIGFGASAIGHLPQGFVQNTPPLNQYKDAVMAGKVATAKGIAFSDEDILRSDVIEDLMCNLTVDLAAIAKKHGVSPDGFLPDMDKLKPLVEDGAVTIDGFTITITELGRPLSRLAAAAFDAYLAEGKARHSRAV